MILGLKKYQEYILYPEPRILGTYSTERLTSTKDVKCPWGGVATNPSDPGHKNGGLFERHGFTNGINILSNGSNNYHYTKNLQVI